MTSPRWNSTNCDGPKDKFGRRLYSRPRIPIIHENAANRANENAEVEATSAKATSSRRQKRRYRRPSKLESSLVANNTISEEVDESSPQPPNGSLTTHTQNVLDKQPCTIRDRQILTTIEQVNKVHRKYRLSLETPDPNNTLAALVPLDDGKIATMSPNPPDNQNELATPSKPNPDQRPMPIPPHLRRKKIENGQLPPTSNGPAPQHATEQQVNVQAGRNEKAHALSSASNPSAVVQVRYAATLHPSFSCSPEISASSREEGLTLDSRSTYQTGKYSRFKQVTEETIGSSTHYYSWSSTNTYYPQSDTNKKNNFVPNNKNPINNTANQLESKQRYGRRHVPRSKWPTKSEIRRFEERNSLAFDNAAANGVAVQSNSGGDSMYDVKKLVDWEGNWLPAPVEWEGRASFQDRNFFDHVEKWITRAERDGPGNLDLDYACFLSEPNGEVAPRCWIPAQIDGEAPQLFFQKLLRTADSTAPVEEAMFWKRSLNEKPWWETYNSPTSVFLAPSGMPEALLDPADEGYERAKKDTGSGTAMLNRAERRAHAEARRKMRKEKAKLERKTIVVDNASWLDRLDNLPPPPNREIKLRANVYLRAIQPADLEQVKDIYNWHIDNSVHCPETSYRTVAHMRGRMADVSAAHLPAIVAVDKSNRSTTRINRPNNTVEAIAGFAYADEYSDCRGIYRFTAELELFVHPDYFNQGIGNCLFDRMVFLMDPYYALREGYEARFDKIGWSAGGSRVVNAILCHLPYDEDCPARILWLRKWMESYDFKQVADMPEVAVKHGKVLHLAVFHYRTGIPFEPHIPPPL